MPVEAKPLFRPDVLHPHLATFGLSEPANVARPALAKWAHLVSSGAVDKFKEQELLPDFLTDLFCNLLGYRRAVDSSDRYTISREKHVQIDGKYADAVLGEFRKDSERFVVAVEGKGPKDPLDRPFAGRKMSAVDQGYRYAINLPCDWIIVTGIRQTRLYFKGADQYTFEGFETERLAADDGLLRKFVFLLGADRVVPTSGKCHLYALLDASEKVGRELTREFYLQYAEIRQSAFEHLSETNKKVPPQAVLAATQKLLDRILFAAFCEDRGLLPPATIRHAYEHSDPYNPRPVWENFRGLFRSVNVGNPSLGIPPYNGGLFAEDPVLESLKVPDDVCRYFRDLAEYDFRPPVEVAGELNGEAGKKLIDVDILGHIFEQSITDLEKIRFELEGLTERVGLAAHTERRKKEGAFYTPSFITRYIAGQAIGGVLAERFERLRQAHIEKATGTATQALVDPNAYEVAKLNAPKRAALIDFWETWQEELKGVRIVDPACGSGAFLIEAFEQMYAAFRASNDRLEELRGHRTLFDLDRQILQTNLYGVDLNEEAIEICRLSLWIKTAQRGKPLTSLDHTIRVGNSVIDNPEVHKRAFDWQDKFPEVFKHGGFDVVLGNPPYVRQEWISPYKAHFQRVYRSYHGTADLYVYFYELGLRLLRPGGRLSYVVTNKWMRSGYGEPLRRLFAEEAWVESVVDFGHAKQIFEDADVFPSIIVARRPNADPPPSTTRVCAIPREQLRINDLAIQIASEGTEVDRAQLGSASWSLAAQGDSALLAKLIKRGKPLAALAGAKPFYGVKTGLNDAFLIDTATKTRLIREDPRSGEIIKPYLRGQDIKRWVPEWAGLWMIFARRGIDIESFPAVKRHLEGFRERLEPKPKNWKGATWEGRKPGSYRWYEVQDPVDYWPLFAESKLVYQDITWRPSFCIDTKGTFVNNTIYFIPTADLWVLAVLNSAVGWWYAWRMAQHGKDEALRYFNTFVEQFPIPEPTELQRTTCDVAVARLIDLASGQQQAVRSLLDWLKVEHDVADPTTKLRSPTNLDSDSFVAEVRKVRGRKKPLTLVALRSLREEFERIIVPAQASAVQAMSLEQQINDLVVQACGLNPREQALIWATAPPRMPITPPLGQQAPSSSD